MKSSTCARPNRFISVRDHCISLPRSNCNMIGWWSVKISWSWHNRKDVTLTMVCRLLRGTASQLHASLNENSIYVMACFRRICLILPNMDYRGNEKYDLVLVQCHDGMIMNSINLVCVLHSSSTRARPNRFISFVIIASWHWTLTRT